MKDSGKSQNTKRLLKVDTSGIMVQGNNYVIH